MFEIYKKSLICLRIAAPALLIFTIVTEGVSWFAQTRSATIGTFIAGLFLIYHIHQYFLSAGTQGLRIADVFAPTRTKTTSRPGLMKFMLWCSALILGPLAASVGVMVGVLIFGSPELLDSPTREEYLAIGSMVVLVYLFSCGFFGTILPASIAQNPAYRMTAGFRIGLKTVWRLLLGPGLASFGVSVFAYLVVQNGLGDAVAIYPAVQFGWNCVIGFAWHLPTILAVAVLSEAYERIMPGAETTDIAEVFS
jgi:hypothetical protein